MFQGDSITDNDRDRSSNLNLAGYSKIVSEYFKDKYSYCNYAISGDTTRQLLARHEDEFKKELPDILVLLIGINDVWRHAQGVYDEAPNKDESISNVIEVIKISKSLNKDVKIIFIEPYVLKGEANLYETDLETYLENIAYYKEKLPSLVDKYIVVQDELYNIQEQGREYTTDGVHPNIDGQKYLANKVIEAITNL